MKSLLKVLFMACACLMAGCAHQVGSSTITGTARPPITAESVKVFTEIPPGSVEIGIVRAFSVGWTPATQNETMNKNLLIEAAKLGANGVVIRKFNINTWTGGDAEGLAFFFSK